MKSSNNTKNPKIGDIYLVYFDGSGNEQKGFRPGLVFQNNVGNEHSPNLIVLPLTSALKKTNQPTHVFIPKEVRIRNVCQNTNLESISLHYQKNIWHKLPLVIYCLHQQ